MYISVGVNRFGDPQLGVLKRRVGQSVAIIPKLEIVVRAMRKTSIPHPKSKRGLVSVT